MREREAFLDKLRAAATCAVVMLHTVTGVMDHTDMNVYPWEKKVFLAVMDLVCWSVPVFLMISGYLFLSPSRKLTMGRMLVKYCRRIALALFGFGVPYACLELIMGEGRFCLGMVAEAFRMVLRGESWSHMWYLYLILVLYLLTPLIKKSLEVFPTPVLYGLLAVLFLGSSILPYLSRLTGLALPSLPDFCIYFFYYIWGGLLAAGRRGRREWSPILAAAAMLLAAGMAGGRLTGRDTLQMAYNYPFTVLLSLLLFCSAAAGSPYDGGKEVSGTFPCTSVTDSPSMGEKRRDAIWKQAAALSFGIYLVHPVFLNIAYKFFHITPLNFPLWLSLPVFFLLTLLLSALAAWVLRRIPPLRKYVL